MRLTNLIRDSFVRAVMADVPKKDFQEEMIKITIKAANNAMPKELQNLIKKNPEIESWIKKEYITTPENCPTVNHFKNANRWNDNWLKNVSPEAWANLEKLGKEKKDQETKHDELTAKIKGCAYGCSTRKQLIDMLPEFEKYLPKDETKAIQKYPIVVNVVADFVKAGWPKETNKKRITI